MSQQETKGMAQYFYRASAADFMKIPGSPIVYWVSDSIRYAFQAHKPFSEYFFSDGLTKTGNNDKFLRFHWEVSRNDAFDKNKYRICVKGGDARDYYGNTHVLVNWKPRVREHYRKDSVARITPEYLWQRDGISWTKISSKGPTFRYFGSGMIAETGGPAIFSKNKLDDDVYWQALGFLASRVSWQILTAVNPTLNFQTNDVLSLPFNVAETKEAASITKKLTEISKQDWDENEIAFDFKNIPLLKESLGNDLLKVVYGKTREKWRELTDNAEKLESKNNEIFVSAYGMSDEISVCVPLHEVSLFVNPYFRYGSNRSEKELEELLQCETIEGLVSYAVGCMMGRFSLDKSGLILGNQGETLKDYLNQVPSPSFVPDGDAIVPFTDEEWFADDAANRFGEFVRMAWGDECLQENLDFVSESLCLHALKPKSGESSLGTLRRYLSTQFYRDHLSTYKKRPIYWLFSSGKHKAFECLVYVHRYNEGTLARMRTEYVLPLSAKLNNYVEKLEQDMEQSTSANETKQLNKEIDKLHKQQAELAEFDEKLRHYADQRISLDLDDGVKVNYGKFGDLLASVEEVTGKKPE